jgi:hypothetical protein
MWQAWSTHARKQFEMLTEQAKETDVPGTKTCQLQYGTARAQGRPSVQESFVVGSTIHIPVFDYLGVSSWRKRGRARGSKEAARPDRRTGRPSRTWARPRGASQPIRVSTRIALPRVGVQRRGCPTPRSPDIRPSRCWTDCSKRSTARRRRNESDWNECVAAIRTAKLPKK